MREILSGVGPTFAEFSAVQLDLHEEGLTVLARGPVGTVVKGRVPVEVVVRFAECGSSVAEGETGVVEAGETASYAGVVACFFEEVWHG